MNVIDKAKRLLKLSEVASPAPWVYDCGNCEVEMKKGRNHVAFVANEGEPPRKADWMDDGEFIALSRNYSPEISSLFLEALEVMFHQKDVTLIMKEYIVHIVIIIFI